MKSFGGASEDRGTDLVQTADSGFIQVGATRSYGAGNLDLLVIKSDKNGRQGRQAVSACKVNRASRPVRSTDRLGL